MTNLVIDIGSAAVKACWADGVTLGRTFRYQGERFMEFILSITSRMKPEVMIVSSIRDITERNEAILRKECLSLILMDNRHKDMNCKLGLPSYISSDRVASITASSYLFKGKGVTLFDCGTTLSIDFIDSGGKYLGGNVSPGCRTRLRAINRYSRYLPLVNMPEDEVGPVGDSQSSSIESGVVLGMEFEISGYFGQYPSNIVVFTGGDAIYFAKRMKNSIFVVCNLVLMGLALIADMYEKKLF